MAFVMSFGRKYGDPPKVHLVYTVTNLSNPHSLPNLRVKPGTHPDVKRWLLGGERGKQTRAVVARIVRDYEALNNPYAIIAIGCFGGRHRSVVVAEEVAKAIGCRVGHRDIGR